VYFNQKKKKNKKKNDVRVAIRLQNAPKGFFHHLCCAAGA
jgi:hypothetical protein